MTFAATVEADILQDAFAPVDALVAECKVHATEDGIEISAVDPANVAMVEMELSAGACAHYEAHDGVLGIDLERMLSVVGMADSGDMVDLSLDEDTRKMHIDIGGLSFTLGLLDPDSIREEPDIPEGLDLPATFVFEGSQLSRAITAADLCSDHVSVVAEDSDELHVRAEGDTDDVDLELDGDDLLSGRLDSEDAVESLFSLEYLTSMSGPIGSETDVSAVMGDELPMKLRYSMHDGDVSVLNLLAPRIQSGGGA
ncbi:PCNA-like protein [environmental Halophage eHP-14]|nr:PCNA-like protein [environmental Halophage eHP-14]